MNATVEKIVNLMFQNTEMTADAQALRDEILNNCQERFEDACAQGKTEDEAIAGVVESLKGMEEVVAGYPKKPGAAERQEGGESYAMSGLTKLYTDLREIDLHLLPTEGGDVIVRYDHEACPDVTVTREGDTLRIVNRSTLTGWNWLADLLQGRNAGKRSLWVSLPAELALEARAMSGDVRARDVRLTAASVHTASGEIELSLSGDCKLGRAEAHSASGEMDLRLRADVLIARNMSGNVRLQGDCDELELSSVSGQVNAHGTYRRASIKSVSGNVRLESVGTALREVNANSTSGNVLLKLDPATSSVRLDASSVSGHARSAFPDQGESSQVRVQAHTVSGNVEVK